MYCKHKQSLSSLHLWLAFASAFNKMTFKNVFIDMLYNRSSQHRLPQQKLLIVYEI